MIYTFPTLCCIDTAAIFHAKPVQDLPLLIKAAYENEPAYGKAALCRIWGEGLSLPCSSCSEESVFGDRNCIFCDSTRLIVRNSLVQKMISVDFTFSWLLYLISCAITAQCCLIS